MVRSTLIPLSPCQLTHCWTVSARRGSGSACRSHNCRCGPASLRSANWHCARRWSDRGPAAIVDLGQIGGGDGDLDGAGHREGHVAVDTDRLAGAKVERGNAIFARLAGNQRASCCSREMSSARWPRPRAGPRTPKAIPEPPNSRIAAPALLSVEPPSSIAEIAKSFPNDRDSRHGTAQNIHGFGAFPVAVRILGRLLAYRKACDHLDRHTELVELRLYLGGVADHHPDEAAWDRSRRGSPGRGWPRSGAILGGQRSRNNCRTAEQIVGHHRRSTAPDGFEPARKLH